LCEAVCAQHNSQMFHTRRGIWGYVLHCFPGGGDFILRDVRTIRTKTKIQQKMAAGDRLVAYEMR
jgi:hypothetical protein